jgi:hypothetical protein
MLKTPTTRQKLAAKEKRERILVPAKAKAGKVKQMLTQPLMMKQVKQTPMPPLAKKKVQLMILQKKD